MELNLNTALETTANAALAYPKIVGCYSVDSERNYHQNFSKLRYLKAVEGSVHFDLNKGFKKFLNKPSHVTRDEKINHMLEFIARNLHKLRLPTKEKPLRYDFVCFRGLLTKIMITPFERENWTMRATCFKGTIYMWTYEEERNWHDKEKFVHWGYKFENYMFAKAPNLKPDASEPANANEEFCVMFSTRINDTLILYGAEVDGVHSNHIIDEEENEILSGVRLVEVKTSRIITNQRGEHTFLTKTLKWFCQSFLVGIDDIYVGFRDDHGIVQEVVKCAVNELPNKAVGLWNKKDCLRFLDAFLKFVLSVVKNQSDPSVTWLFDYDCRDKIVRVRRKENSEEYSFLPQWYTEMLIK